MKSVIINKNDAGQRIDKFLHKYFKSAMPTSLIYKNIRKKRIKINKKRTDIDTMVNEGDLIEMYINDEFFEPAKEVTLKHVKVDFDVIYEDENIILIDKKAGTVVHDDDNGSVNTLVAQLHVYLMDKKEYNPNAENSFAPALCNRIDRNTSGIVIAAKNAQSLREMNEIIKNRMVAKKYLALVTGKLQNKEQTLKGYLFKDSKQNKVYITQTPQRGAQEIITAYKVIKYNADSTLVEVELITGKTHQIRAHFASIGHPLVGDGKYGKLNNKNSRKFQALHSYKLEFSNNFKDMNLSYLMGKTFISNSADFI